MNKTALRKFIKIPKRVLKAYLIKRAKLIGMEYPSNFPVDFRGLTTDAENALSRAAGRPVLLNQPIDLFRGLFPIGYRLAADAGHPHVLEAQAYIRRKQGLTTSSPLEDYFNIVQPSRAIEVLGITPDASLSGIEQYSLDEAALPWAGKLGKHVSKARNGWLANDVREHLGSMHPLVKKVQGYFFLSGPVTQEYIDFEKLRIKRVVNSIQSNGYDLALSEGAPQMEAMLLSSSTDHCLVIRKGQHRAAALAALGYKEVPIIINPKVIRREEVANWPAVIAKNMSENEALQVFDRLIAGKAPEVIESSWVTNLPTALE